MGFVPALRINTGGALAGSGMTRSNPNYSMVGAAAGTAIGFPLGSKIEGSLNNVLNPWYRQEWKDVGMGIFVSKNPVPSWVGGIISSGAQEFVNNKTQQTDQNLGVKK